MATANTYSDKAVFTSEELAGFETEANGQRRNFRVTALRSGQRIYVNTYNGFTAEEAIRYQQAIAQDMEAIYGKLHSKAACNLSDWQAEEVK
jgi:hypothetical protein